MDINTANEMQLIQHIAMNVFKNMIPSEVQKATLVSLEPIKFQFSKDVICNKDEIIFPENYEFLKEDINNEYLFIRDLGGKKRIFLYDVKNNVYPKMTQIATLISLTPIKFKFGSFIYEINELIFPDKKTFTTDDLNRQHLFIRDFCRKKKVYLYKVGEV